MLRDFLINKWFLGGIGFLVVFAVVCELWYQHDTATERKAATEEEQMLRQIGITIGLTRQLCANLFH